MPSFQLLSDNALAYYVCKKIFSFDILFLKIYNENFIKTLKKNLAFKITLLK